MNNAAATTTISLKFHKLMRTARLVGTLKNGRGIYELSTGGGTYHVRRAAYRESAKGYTQAKGLTEADYCGATYTCRDAYECAVSRHEKILAWAIKGGYDRHIPGAQAVIEALKTNHAEPASPAVDEAPAATKTAFTKRTLKNESGTVFVAQYAIWYAKDGRFGTDYDDWQRVGPEVSSSASFISHLCKNWTVEDYFSALDAGESPDQIVKRTGYLSPREKRWLRDNGYPATPAGMADFEAATNARDA